MLGFDDFEQQKPYFCFLEGCLPSAAMMNLLTDEIAIFLIVDLCEENNTCALPIDEQIPLFENSDL